MLKVENINVFAGKKQLIRNASFQVKSRDIVGLIGPNGAGKTTIMKTILGLMTFNGKISVDESPVTENNHKPLSKVGALIENPAIYPFLTGLQNLQLYSFSKSDMYEVIHQLKMDNYIDQKSKDYSLGMKQKLGIAIALLNKPELVILDEPMNGLDIESTILVRKLIRKYSDQGTAFLISSHILSELQKIMTNIIIINDGSLIINEPIDEFKNVKNGHYQLITENQKKAQKLLHDNKISEKQTSEYILINKNDIFEVQTLLFNNNIKLLELSPEKNDFEQLVVGFLQKKAETNEI